MNIERYIMRFFSALIFIYSGIEKLFLPYNPSVFKSDMEMINPKFFEFYDFLMGVGNTALILSHAKAPKQVFMKPQASLI